MLLSRSTRGPFTYEVLVTIYTSVLSNVFPVLCCVNAQVQLHGAHRARPLVRGDELLRPLDDVHVLRDAGDAHPHAQVRRHPHHQLADPADGRRLLRLVLRLHHPAQGRVLPAAGQHRQLRAAHVRLLLRAVRQVLLQHVRLLVRLPRLRQEGGLIHLPPRTIIIHIGCWQEKRTFCLLLLIFFLNLQVNRIHPEQCARTDANLLLGYS